MDGCTDGTWLHTGRKYFECEHGKGIYYPLNNLKQDERFCEPGNISTIATGENRKYLYIMLLCCSNHIKY